MKKHIFTLAIAILFLFMNSTATLAASTLPANITLITPAEIVKKVETSTRPFILLLVASWCPYCKKQMADLAKLTPAEQLQIPEIVGVSVDSKPEAYAAMMREYKSIFWPMKLYAGDSSIEGIIQNYGGTFDGSIPYTAIFQNRKITKEFNGLTSTDSLKLAQ